MRANVFKIGSSSRQTHNGRFAERMEMRYIFPLSSWQFSPFPLMVFDMEKGGRETAKKKKEFVLLRLSASALNAISIAS